MGKKTNNKSIRFNSEHFDFAKEKIGIKTEQELVDRLLSDFYEAWNPKQPIFSVNVGEVEINGYVTSGESNLASNSQNTPKDTPRVEKGQDKAEIEARIEVLEREIAKGAQSSLSSIGKKAYIFDREKELKQLKSRL